MVAVLYGAILFAVYGLISAFSDQDVIAEPDAGPLVGPIMAFTALCIVFLSVLFGLRPTPGATPIPVGRATVTGLAVYVIGTAAGAIVYVFGQETLLAGLHFFIRHLLSPFVFTATLLAVVMILLLPVIARARSGAR